MTSDPQRDFADDEHEMPALDIFLPNASFLHLEEDWRRGLGWWLVDDERKRRITLSEAVRLAPIAVSHEVLLEAQLLVWRLETDDLQDSEPGLHDAISRLRREVALANAAEGSSPAALMQAARMWRA